MVVYGVTMEADADYEEFFRTTFERAIRSVSRIERDPGLAEDAAIEAFARAHLHWRSVGPDPNREAWVLRVAINASIDQGRRNRRRRRPTDADRRATEIEDHATDRIWVVHELRRLPRRQREAVALRHLADLSEHETAAAMGVSIGSVKTHVHRGLRALGRSMHEFEEVGADEEESDDARRR